MGSAAVLGSVALVASTTPSALAAEETGEAAVPYQSEILQQVPALNTTTTGQEDANYLLTTPGGLGGTGAAAIYDNSGNVVWVSQGNNTNFQQINFQGEPALAMLNNGRAVVLDSTYTEVASVGMSGYTADLHSLAFNDDGSRVLMLAYNNVTYDLSPWGGSTNALLAEPVIQEVNTLTGEVTFEWRGLDHIPVEESHQPLTGSRVDYVHANSLFYDSDGKILMSGRFTSTIYKIDPASGDIEWRFGGESSDFTFSDPFDMPRHQHDASRLADGRLAAFDNGTDRNPPDSRGSVWDVDEQAMTAELVLDLQPSASLVAYAMGSNQPTANGNMLVNFGNTGQLFEFSGTNQVFSGTFTGSSTYKATRSTDWVGTPATAPDVAWTDADADGSRDLYMSWNGATEVDAWRVEARSAEGAGTFTTVANVDKTGFETHAEVTAPSDAGTLRVSALDDTGQVLSTRVLTEGQTATID